MFDGSSKIYRGHVDMSERNSAWTKIIDFVEEGERVLEVGCAEGYMSEFLTRNTCCTVTGIEANLDMARVAARRCQTVIVGDVENGAFGQIRDQFDVIIFADVLEHLRSPGRVLRASRALLAKDGFVLLSLPNVAHWDVRRNLLIGRFDYTSTGLLDDGHLRFFTWRTALKLIHEAGFAVETFDLVHRLPRYWKYPNLYLRWEVVLHRLVMKYFREIFGYQFIFKVRPQSLSTNEDLNESKPGPQNE